MSAIPAPESPAQLTAHALATGFSRGFGPRRQSRCSPCWSRWPPSGSAARTWPAPAKHGTKTRHPSPPPRDSIRTGPCWRQSVPAAPVS